jgi:WD40 repeat protein
MEWRSVVDILSLREYAPTHSKSSRELIENIAEDSCLKSELRSVNLASSANVSTIAISMSHDGKYFATTHGDHTVKVFLHQNLKLFRVFRGHPRTPWTVKFHPTNSNIIASGCLGSQVRIYLIFLKNF